MGGFADVLSSERQATNTRSSSNNAVNSVYAWRARVEGIRSRSAQRGVKRKDSHHMSQELFLGYLTGAPFFLEYSKSNFDSLMFKIFGQPSRSRSMIVHCTVRPQRHVLSERASDVSGARWGARWFFALATHLFAVIRVAHAGSTAHDAFALQTTIIAFL